VKLNLKKIEIIVEDIGISRYRSRHKIKIEKFEKNHDER
jgi:hypothetical protein